MKRILVGAVVMLVSEIAMLLQIEPFWSWHTAIAWTGYISFIDGIVYMRRRSSWLSNARAEFAFLAAVSVPLWLVFEFYNLFIRNWHYINLPENIAVRYFGYAWAFATIWPAIFETADLIATFRTTAAPVEVRNPSFTRISTSGVVSIAVGAAMLLWPIVWASPYLAAPVWLGFIFLLDPSNSSFGEESLTVGFGQGNLNRAFNLAIAGLVCGLIWEFWNYWARTKWIYTVPILPDLKIFEMPLAGYLGFPAFALECFTMYVTVRLLFWRGEKRPIAL